MSWPEPQKNQEGKSPIHQAVAIKGKYTSTLREPVQKEESVADRLRKYVKQKEQEREERRKVPQKEKQEKVYELTKKDSLIISEMSLSEFRNTIMHGFVYSGGYGTEEAMLLPSGHIALTPKFFELDTRGRKHVLRHEEGHRWEGRIVNPDNYWQIYDSGIFGNRFNGIFGSSTKNLHEPMAEAKAVYDDDKTALKKQHPAAYHFIEEIEHGKTWQQALDTAKRYPYKGVKEIWQMTKEEYIKYDLTGTYQYHNAVIREAIKKGKDVPSDVKSQYDL